MSSTLQAKPELTDEERIATAYQFAFVNGCRRIMAERKTQQKTGELATAQLLLSIAFLADALGTDRSDWFMFGLSWFNTIAFAVLGVVNVRSWWRMRKASR